MTFFQRDLYFFFWRRGLPTFFFLGPKLNTQGQKIVLLFKVSRKISNVFFMKINCTDRRGSSVHWHLLCSSRENTLRKMWPLACLTLHWLTCLMIYRIYGAPYRIMYSMFTGLHWLKPNNAIYMLFVFLSVICWTYFNAINPSEFHKNI